VDEIWTRIVAWFHTHAPELAPDRRGAAPRAIEEAEAELGLALPADYRAWLLLCDGQSTSAPGVDGLWRLHSVADVLDRWRMLRALDSELSHSPVPTEPGIRAGVWNAAWVPIAEDLGGNYLAIDLDPGRGGTMGQVIDCQHDPPSYGHHAPGFRAFLARLADDLEAGRYQVHRSRTGRITGLEPVQGR
jgi:cell wall assembly regulator SMI1